MFSYEQVLKESEKQARHVGLEASAVKLLLLHYSKLLPTELYLKFHEEMPEETYKAFQNGLHLYLVDKKPVQYIIGYVYFYGYPFHVDENVLIPRFETEELVANVLIQYDELFHGQEVNIVDIGTGSGCLAIALKKEESRFNMFATDLSEDALMVAKMNADRNEAKIDFLAGDMLQPLQGKKFDIIVSNPPYIPTTEKVDDLIHQNEPHMALYGGEDGLVFYEVILSGAKDLLNDKSFIAFEHAYDKKNEIQTIARKYFPNANIYTLQDMQGKDRMTFVVNQ